MRRAANPAPRSLPLTERGRAKRYIEQYDIDALPLVDKKGRIADIILPAGRGCKPRLRGHSGGDHGRGLGTRLYPYTKILPKPLIPVGGAADFEHIIDRFRDFGCADFRLVVNYKKA